MSCTHHIRLPLLALQIVKLIRNRGNEKKKKKPQSIVNNKPRADTRLIDKFKDTFIALAGFLVSTTIPCLLVAFIHGFIELDSSWVHTDTHGGLVSR